MTLVLAFAPLRIAFDRLLQPSRFLGMQKSVTDSHCNTGRQTAWPKRDSGRMVAFQLLPKCKKVGGGPLLLWPETRVWVSSDFHWQVS